MTQTSERLNEVLDRIDSTEPADRYVHHADLVHAIHEIEDVGGTVPAKVHQLAEDLLNDAMEARFENMPV